MDQAINHAIKALDQKQFFKLVCGASLTDVQMVENLCFLFALAGAHVFDLAPTADVIFAARRGIETAKSQQLRANSPLIMASIQLDKDPHFRKVEVDFSTCDLCGACVKVCPTEAFNIENKKFVYLIERCYGCGICPEYCHVDALKMKDINLAPEETLKEMILLGVKAIEIHFGSNAEKLFKLGKNLREYLLGIELLSFSISSSFSAEEIREIAHFCCKIAGKKIILQCDGIPMSGAQALNGNNKDEAALQVAKILQEENLPAYLQIAGGTNERSYEKAISAALNIHGVAIGSYARKLLMPYINNLTAPSSLKEALFIAKKLVSSVNLKQLACEVSN